MKIATFNNHRVGLVEGDLIYDVTQAVPDAGPAFPQVYMSRLIDQWPERRDDILAARQRAQGVSLETVTLNAPNPAPFHVVAAPVNYRKHIGEIGARSVSGNSSAIERGFFLKASSSVSGPGDGIVLPKGSTRRFDHESELAVIIGRRAKNIPREQALDYVFGYSCLIDMTMRMEPGVGDEERVARKSFDTFTSMGPYIVTADEIPDPGVLGNRLWVNDQLRQDSNTSALILDVPGLIEWASSVMTLQPGDVIATGTPEGVGPVVPGDRVRMTIEKIGTLTVDVKEAVDFAPKRF
ncbi:2-hydroxyhepta-2,4-diene-1,7-dioate isomerase [Advenella kashmirensis W13003]|uniref:2-hydroxyhepta-2,4-diene-1,7-dioate isomerase n=1 Tax=Advenella kashmirensis W13003 TaxID=1424334 RepID=V8QRT6_9BURK|nr:fumarylacetoacetate hydrolase family protein [Advenella kashmirensis]ETF02691.1 2-hydroxyhepta-2,4-diene-1,7-dioate isomerase [Advenella kashmirensis W13003]